MIIWGFRVIFRTLSTGVFLCPQEGADRPYRLRSAQRFFTLFFVPLIPLKKHGNVVECVSCTAQYDEVILTRPTAAAQGSNWAEAIRASVISVMRVGGHNAKSQEQGLSTVNEYFPTYTESALLTDLAQLDIASLPQLLSATADYSQPGYSEGLVARLTLIAFGDTGRLSEEQRRLLMNIGGALGMTPAHTHGTIDSVSNQI